MTPQKLRIISSWEEKEKKWEENAKEASSLFPIKTISRIPNMPGITKKTARFLKLKSIFYILSQDKTKIFKRYFLKHPFKYSFNILASYLSKYPYKREGDLFFYGVKDLDSFKKEALKKETLFVVGFSYCHKPFECPSGRFSSECINSKESSVCKQCFIGKMCHLMPKKNTQPLFIPTVHYIGEKMFEVREKNPDKNVVFLITACEMTLKMFADWGNMLQLKGIGIRLDGRICNTMKAFELSEHGIKPGLTVVLPETQKIMLEILRFFNPYESGDKA